MDALVSMLADAMPDFKDAGEKKHNASSSLTIETTKCRQFAS